MTDRILAQLDCPLCRRIFSLESREKVCRKQEDLLSAEMVSECRRYLSGKHKICGRCQILIGEHHIERIGHKARAWGLICSDCRKRLAIPPVAIDQSQKSLVGLWEHWRASVSLKGQAEVAEQIKSDEGDWGWRNNGE